MGGRGPRRPSTSERPGAERVEELVVHLDASGRGGDQVVGMLRCSRRGTVSAMSFAYDDSWLVRPDAFDIDPSLRRGPGDQYVGALPGIFADTAPDRWGRVLLERREARSAEREGRRPRALDQWDLLTLVSDQLRMGALRVARRSDGAYVAAERHAVPLFARLRELEQLAQEVERGHVPTEEEEALLDLIAPGSSLGGNRPKANVRADDGSLWIAKFPSRNDRWDVGAWEYLLNQLAAASGITVPKTELHGPLASSYRIFAAQRFDRSGGDRHLFASAMTLTSKGDHQPASYLDIAQALTRSGDPDYLIEDLGQLFRRVVFNVLVGHRDDHLRNHGFLHTGAGWRLTPAYDLNPTPDNTEHALALDDSVRRPNLDVVIGTAPLYRVTTTHAREIVAQVQAAIAPWRQEAQKLAIPRDEIAQVAGAFAD